MDANDLKILSTEDLQKEKLPNITLSEDQTKATTAVCDWYTDKERSERFILAGLAGTGKSTIIPFILNKLGIAYRNVHFCAYTGKASLVLQSKGLDATTIHRLIYTPKIDPLTGECEFSLKDELDRELKLIIVDEASMVGKTMQEDLESFGIPVLYVGDHGQLPPVGDEFARLMEVPNVKLEKIHRQAEGNAIIKAAMQARSNGRLNHGKIGDTVVKLRKITFPRDKLLTADQVLCGKNATRHALNTEIRGMHKQVHQRNVPSVGEKLICLRNDSDTGLINGMIGTLDEIGKLEARLDYKEIPHFRGCTFTDETGFKYKNINIDAKLFAEKKTDVYYKKVQRFDYGYAITVHKSQGSQYNNLVVFEEYLGDSDFHRTWLYTAVTRAIENLIIVQG